jgi:electron transport complex protein RnfG
MSERLPTVEATVSPAAVGRAPTSSGRLVATLAVAGALAGLLIVLVHQWSEPKIEAHRARVLAEAVDEVLAAPATTVQLYLVDGGFVEEAPPAADTAALDRVWLGMDETGNPVGVAAVASAAGFQDVIRLIFGYDPGSGAVLGMKVLESRETPGLGDKIEKDSAFVREFREVTAPLVGVKPSKATGADGEIDMITGATISSEAVIDIINARLAEVGAPLDRWWAGRRATEDR